MDMFVSCVIGVDGELHARQGGGCGDDPSTRCRSTATKLAEEYVGRNQPGLRSVEQTNRLTHARESWTCVTLSLAYAGWPRTRAERVTFTVTVPAATALAALAVNREAEARDPELHVDSNCSVRWNEGVG